jgi:excisionase family DNA binding protein
MRNVYPCASSNDVQSTKQTVSENFFDKEQLAEKLAMSQSYIDKLMTQGLPRYKFGRSVRFRFSEVMEWLQKRRFP